MVLTYLLISLGFLLLVIGFIGCFLPALPGPPLSYIGMLMIHFSSLAEMTTDFLLLWLVITLVVTVIDYFVPIYGSRRFGGTRSGMIGASIGLVVGIFFFPPFGIILGPLLGAFLGELMKGQRQNALTQVPHKLSHSLHKRIVVATFGLCIFNVAQLSEKARTAATVSW